MAVIRKRGDSWEVDYRINGRRIKKVIRDKRTAILYLKDIEVKIAKGELGFEIKDTDLNKLLNDYLPHVKATKSPGTLKRYKAVIDHFKNFLENYPYIKKISQLGPKTFDDYIISRQKEGAKNKTINLELQTLRSMFNFAKSRNLTANNPTDGVKKLRIPKQIAPRFLSEEECKKLLDNCNEWEYPIFYTFLNTGMRKSELLNLEWSDIDFNRRKIKICVKNDWSPKTDEREIPINNSLHNLFKDHKEKQPKGKYVFQDKQGKQIENNRLRKRLMSISERAGFPDVTKLHTLRHTFASHLVMKGVDLPTVMKLMGHADIQTTMIYAHLADKHINKAVEKLNFSS